MITGKDLIIYILSNNLENKPISLETGFLNLMSEEEAAIKFEVGTATIRALCENRLIRAIKVGDNYYILPDDKPLK